MKYRVLQMKGRSKSAINSITGAKPGRTGDDQVTIFDSTGAALQDVASAAAIYEKALRQPGMHTVAFGC